MRAARPLTNSYGLSFFSSSVAISFNLRKIAFPSAFILRMLRMHCAVFATLSNLLLRASSFALRTLKAHWIAAIAAFLLRASSFALRTLKAHWITIAFLLYLKSRKTAAAWVNPMLLMIAAFAALMTSLLYFFFSRWDIRGGGLAASCALV